MRHIDDNALVRYSFGEDVPDASQREHLKSCSRCGTELASLERLVALGRTLDSEDLVEPPDTVWNGIHAELGLSSELDAVPSPLALGAADDARRSHRAVATLPRPAREPLRSRRRTATILISAAALVVGLIAGIAGTVWLSRPADPRVLAEAILEPFPNWDASGIARVEAGEAGSRTIVVDVAAPGGGLTEVWLIDPETSGLVSLGLLSGESGSFAVPEGLDLSRYSVVDVSREPTDGNPAHSGDSIVRGQLRTS